MGEGGYLACSAFTDLASKIHIFSSYGAMGAITILGFPMKYAANTHTHGIEREREREHCKLTIPKRRDSREESVFSRQHVISFVGSLSDSQA